MQETGGDVGAGCLASGAESQGRRGVGGGRGGPHSAGAASAADHGAPGVTPAQHCSQRPGSRPCVFTLSVPFPSALEAEIARGSLAPDTEPHRGAVGKELTVSGNVLAVCWRAEDCRLLRISIVNFLDQLSLVVRTMQRFGPPVAR
ncbi:EKC/KEOPS complex subunit LAGE3 [Oryx dammah]|uniref:EKC/KEOPS complex subunit LAGE3 n=1 Tax=Oryx dammah TaxID=59534 RepID=UPI001A9BFC5D|nr:EKC/KEOPS complex subunit LAGE3 [Oryx dammah]